VIKATQQSEHQPYDVVRQALKEVELDSSRRVELDDYVDVGAWFRARVRDATADCDSSSRSCANPHLPSSA
jgi:plastin-1